MSRRTFVIGVGMTRFEKPQSKDWEFPDMAREAGTKALADAGIAYDAVQQAYVGFVGARSTSGQRAVYELGMSGIPVVNVNNNCSTGATALFLARQAITGGTADCVLALGFEKMQKGPLNGGAGFSGPSPLEQHLALMDAERGRTEDPVNAQLFGNAGREHQERYGSGPEHVAWIAWKNHKHSVNNPYAQFQTEYTMAEIRESRMIFDPLTKLACSPTSDGSAAAVVASEAFVEANRLWERAIEITGQAMTTDSPKAFGDRSCIEMIGADMTRRAAAQALAQAGSSIEDVDVIELHDCFATNELITYEGLGMAPEGKGHLLVENEATTYGGQWVVNPSGGLISKGHPLGRHRSGAVRGADVAAARHRRPQAGRGREHRTGPQPGTRWGVRGLGAGTAPVMSARVGQPHEHHHQPLARLRPHRLERLVRPRVGGAAQPETAHGVQRGEEAVGEAFSIDVTPQGLPGAVEQGGHHPSLESHQCVTQLRVRVGAGADHQLHPGREPGAGVHAPQLVQRAADALPAAERQPALLAARLVRSDLLGQVARADRRPARCGSGSGAPAFPATHRPAPPPAARRSRRNPPRPSPRARSPTAAAGSRWRAAAPGAGAAREQVRAWRRV